MNPLSILNRSKYLSLVMVALLGSVVLYVERGSATDDPSIEETSSPVCQLLGKLFQRSVSSYEHEFGPVLSSRVQQFGSAAVGYSGRTVAVHLAQHVMIGYFVWTDKSGEVITLIEAEGQETLRTLGLDVHSREDVERLLGQAHYLASGEPTDPAFRSRDVGEIGNKPIGYLCDSLPGEQKIDPPSTSSIGIDPVSHSITVSFHWPEAYD